jgi:RIO-like serine/threonine protein kinase
MDTTDLNILNAIETVSPKRSISPVKVNEVLKLDENELGNRLMKLKKSGHVDILISDYPSSLSLPNAISKVFLTELGRKALKEKG